MKGVFLFFWTAFLSFMPISELRGAIPFALANGVPWYAAYPFAVVINALVAPACWIFLSTVHRLFYGRVEDTVEGGGQAGNGAVSGQPVCQKAVCGETAYRGGFRWYRKFFDRFVERARQKLRRSVERWGWIAVAAFVAVPLPVTGAWTGTLGAWVLGLPKRRTLPAVIIGVAVAGAVVTAVALLGIQAFSLFIKKMGSQ
ncbi:MAG: small multi-drug export protein [Treponema sp.]|jgi:uncharacterized membrane protein|nr:small multi-drug export protein [Treponema sp.]